MRRTLMMGAALALLASALVTTGSSGVSATPRDTDDTCGSAPAAGFTDVTGDNVHRRAIDCIRHRGVTTGRTATTYEPRGQLVRSQLASFLDRTLTAADRPLPAATRDWFDDDRGSVHEHAINRLAEAGIVPTSTRRFGVDVVSTRAEMARLTTATLRHGGVVTDADVPPDFYTDDDSSPDERAINLLSDLGIVSGRTWGVFAPAEALRRDQMATFLARSIDALRNGRNSHQHCRVHAPERPRFDPWYSQQCEVFGIAVVGSSRVDGQALRNAADVVEGMLGERPEIHADLARNGFYLILLGEEEKQTDPPEYRNLNRDFPGKDWDQDRGIASSGYASAGEENVLCRPSDPYSGESILVHEFAHSILDAVERIRPGFAADVERAYAQSMAAGRWSNTYAATNHHELWAEGVQSFFDANLQADPPDGIHNHVDTREELQRYDGELHRLAAVAFGPSWRYACP